jgi:hypothetical protein
VASGTNIAPAAFLDSANGYRGRGGTAWAPTPPLGVSRDDIAVDILRCIDITICSMAGVESERLCCGSALHNTHDEAEARAIAGLIVRSHSLAAIDALSGSPPWRPPLVDANIGIVLSLARELLTHRNLDAAHRERKLPWFFLSGSNLDRLG